jgi:hypothetical protein
VQQNLRSLATRFGADVDWALFEQVFHRRLQDDEIKFARALEANFQQPRGEIERRIQADIQAYRRAVGMRWETDLFKQKKRLASLRSTEFLETDERMFPRYFVPLVVREGDRLLIRPMRYQCRLAGKPATHDERYPGTYNAFGAFLTVSN